MVKTPPIFINPYSSVVGQKVEKVSRNYGIRFLEIDSRRLANINRPDYFLYGDECIVVEGEKENINIFVNDASTPRKDLEQRVN